MFTHYSTRTLTERMFWYAVMLAGALIALGLLSGCGTINAAVSGATNYLTGAETATKANVQKADDLNLKTWADTGCAAPYGAVVRNASGNPKLPAAIIDLCGLPQGVTIVTTGSAVTVTTGTGSVSVPTSTTTVAPAPVSPE